MDAQVFTIALAMSSVVAFASAVACFVLAWECREPKLMLAALAAMITFAAVLVVHP